MIQPGDRIEIGGGYDMNPAWLKGRSIDYHAEVLRFLDNSDKNRSGEGRLSAVVRFDEEIEFGGLQSRFGILDLRYVGQKWDDSGVVHVELIKDEPVETIERQKKNSRWMESHASYKKIV
jgi:hypothetical protein